MDMQEITITYENLFKLIELEEKISYVKEQEYFQSTPIQIKNEDGHWVNVKGLIIKETEVLELEIDANERLVCAKNHILQVDNNQLIYAKTLAVGDLIKSTKQDEPYIITNINNLDEKQIVYDIEVDSEAHLYQCAMGIVHHNTLLTSAIIQYANMLNMRTITIVPSSSLLKQTHDYIKQFEIPVGMFGAGKKDDQPNIVATWQTLQNNKSFIKDFECIIWDECVHPSSKITLADNSEKRIDTLEIGDLVKTFNEETKQIENKPIKKIHKNLIKSQNQKMFKITMEDGSNVVLTGNHEVLTDNGWKRADALTLTDNVISLSDQSTY